MRHPSVERSCLCGGLEGLLVWLLWQGWRRR